MLRPVVQMWRRLQMAYLNTPHQQRLPLFIGLAMTFLLTFILVYPAVTVPSFPPPSSSASSSTMTRPMNSLGANAAKRTLAMNDNDIDDTPISRLGNNKGAVVAAAGGGAAMFPGNVGAALRGTNSFNVQGHAARAADGELVSIQIVHRHGARSPIHPAPKQQSQWTPTGLGIGHLTVRGRAQHEAFGKKLRAKYVTSAQFLPEKAPGSDLIYVRSSDVDRCLISVQSLLQGLWQGSMIPIHTISEDIETLLQPTDKCVAYKSNHAAVIKRWSQTAKDKLPDVLKKLKEITGFSIVGEVETTDRDQPTVEVRAGNLISIMVDNNACAQAQGIPLDDYLTPDVIDQLRKFTLQMYFQQYGMDYNGTQDDLHDPRGPSGTQLVRLIRDNFDAKTMDSNVPKRRLSIFSAHDTTLVALASSLGLLREVNDHLLPPFAASMVFELRKKNGKYYINALYGRPQAKPEGDLDKADGWDYVLEPMAINCPGSSSQCLFDDWSERYIEKVNPVPSKSDGCCLRTEGFYQFGCDNYTRPYKELPSECQAYRRVCPVSSCDSNQVLNAATLSCVNIADDTNDGEPTTAKAIGIGFMAAGALLCLLAMVSRYRNKVPSVRSLDGSTPYAPVLTLRR